ncbi:MAG TPA: HEAT repeat domain-containing protein [Bryobacteraceae bacterium]|nr:HEAT repeat domain-containing protein [Bryobacteraceae bacterium]
MHTIDSTEQCRQSLERSDTGLAEHSVEPRSRAVHALGLIPANPRAQEQAQKALGDHSGLVRSAAANALGAMGAKAAIPKLMAALKDKDVEVVLASAASLHRLQDPGAYPVYYAILSGEKKSGESLIDSELKMVKDSKAMAKLGFEQCIGFIPFAGVSYSVFKEISKDDTSPIRAAAAQKLAHDPDPRSGKALVTAATDKKWLVRAAAVDAIARRGDPTLLPGVAPLLTDENESVRYNAAAAIIHLSAGGAKRQR